MRNELSRSWNARWGWSWSCECERTISTWPIHNCTLAYAKRFQFADLTCCCSLARRSDKLAYSPQTFLQTMSIYKRISVFFHICSLYFLSEYFGLDDKMTLRTTWGLPCDNIFVWVMADACSQKHASKKRIFIGNFELKFGMRDYWPSTNTESKKKRKSQNFVLVAL